MSILTLRLTKGSPLTNAELDNNFTALNTDKLEKSVFDAVTGTATTQTQLKTNLGIVDALPLILALS